MLLLSELHAFYRLCHWHALTFLRSSRLNLAFPLVSLHAAPLLPSSALVYLTPLRRLRRLRRRSPLLLLLLTITIASTTTIASTIITTFTNFTTFNIIISGSSLFGPAPPLLGFGLPAAS